MHVGGGAKIYKSDGCGTLIKVDDFGKIDVYSGSMDIGQGLDTVLRQIVAETLGVKTSAVNVVIGDTDVCPWDVGVHASRSTFIAGNAALGAARLVREQILQFAAGLLDEPVESPRLYRTARSSLWRTPRRPRPWTACCARPTSPGATPPCSWPPTSTSRPPTSRPPT